MTYKIQIFKDIPNPNYEKQLEYFKNRNYYNGNINNEYPPDFVDSKILECELTEEEYKTIKRAVLEVK